ncbi:MAG: hypothetical protein CMI01_14845 [Oceanospirillaceae bacterium]|nr:hypothetical protein [Oceanospirillaceae bacterium]
MLSLIRQKRTDRLVEALRQGDRDRLARLNGKFTPQTLLAPLSDPLNAIEISLEAGQATSLEWVMTQLPEPCYCAATGEPYIVIALRQRENSLGLVTTLLQAGADPNQTFEQRTLVHWCFEHCSPESLMLHLSRLNEYGADLNDASLLTQALEKDHQALVHFLIHSGTPLPDDLEGVNCAPDLITYAKRCAEDRRIREMMLGR